MSSTARERAEHAQILETVLRETGHSLDELHPDRPPRTTARFHREDWRILILNELADRDGLTCYLCQTPIDRDDADIDHIIPVSLGGENRLHNLALACPDCNRQKAAKIVAFYVTSGRPWYAWAASQRLQDQRGPIHTHTR